MKNFIAILSLCFLWACNTNGSSQKEIPARYADTLLHPHEESKPELSLNNGAKWKADKSTNKHVKTLQATTDNFIKSNHTSLADYQYMADELQGGIEKMINECRMKGADHDVLHKWLHPLLRQVKALKTAPATGEATQAFEKIKQQLSLYNKYF